MATVAELRAQARRLLVAYALTSTKRAGGLVDVVARGRPDSAAPSGESAHPAERWAVELERLHDGELERFVGRLRDELDHVRRRPLAEAHVEAETLADLAELVLDRGAGWPARTVAISLRTSETLVRRVRLAAGLSAEDGRHVAVNGHGSLGLQLVGAGLSFRAASVVSGTPKSTLADQARRAR